MPNLTKTVNGEEIALTQDELAIEVAKEAVWQQTLAEQAAIKYQLDRQQEYPTIEEIVIALIEDSEGRPEALADIKARRAAVQSKYPKP